MRFIVLNLIVLCSALVHKSLQIRKNLHPLPLHEGGCDLCPNNILLTPESVSSIENFGKSIDHKTAQRLKEFGTSGK
jgi:hypothetical protein